MSGQITDDMVKTIMNGGGVQFDDFIFNLNTASSFPNGMENLGTTLHAISRDGKTILLQQVEPFNKFELRCAFIRMIDDMP